MPGEGIAVPVPTDDSTPDDSGADDERALTAITGEAAPDEVPIEPGSPSLENAVFVLLGVLVALSVVVRLFQLFG